MRTYEYKAMEQPAKLDDAMNLLRRQGEEGWELAMKDWHHFIFKRALGERESVEPATEAAVVAAVGRWVRAGDANFGNPGFLRRIHDAFVDLDHPPVEASPARQRGRKTR